MTTQTKISPMMEQWHACKVQAGDALLMFRMGDFYEAFYDDAIEIAKELELTLTKRQEIPMCGVPWHASAAYFDKLVANGHHVAIAEQVEDPKKAKGLVRREVVRVISPGSLIASQLLSEKSNNYFAGITQLNKGFALALLDHSTAEFRVMELDNERELLNECFRARPAEFLVSASFKQKFQKLFNELKLCYRFVLNVEDEWKFDHQVTLPFLIEHFQVQTLDGFGLQGRVGAINAAGALLKYFRDVLTQPIDHVRSLSLESTEQILAIDYNSQRNLELTHSLKDGSRHNTLLECIDRTVTPMGGRLIGKWLVQPLCDTHRIQLRQDAVEELVFLPEARGALQQDLRRIRDLERLMMKISGGYATARDIVALRFSLEPLAQVKAQCERMESALLRSEGERIKPLPELGEWLEKALVDEPPIRIGEGKVIREGYHEELDELRTLSMDSRGWIMRYQESLKADTGIKTLKVSYSKAFGYYIEVSKGQAAQMPGSFERRQTLVNAERFISPELKEYESKILNAEEQIQAIEQSLFVEIRDKVLLYFSKVLENAAAIAQIDVLLSLAEVAAAKGYVRPTVTENHHIAITHGRHPIIESLTLGEAFVPNDVHLTDHERLMLITGPNMAGKSTYMRQVALIVVMAQMGGFVPAERAVIGLVDRLFTRIGASDDLARGQSTFMVEMTETAAILHNATERSLVILDEIGRGTSTYDGISIAWAVAEYLLQSKGLCPRTLFATHYFELTELESKLSGAVNYTVSVQECNDRVVFLRKIIKGCADKSYGIHVAGLAGLPPRVLTRAKEILKDLEAKPKKQPAKEQQLMLFSPPQKDPLGDQILKELSKMDIENMTPVQALSKLAEMKSWI